MKITLCGYWSHKSLHYCQYSIFPKILDSHSVPLHIFQIQVEQNRRSFRENEGKIDPISYLVSIVRCQTVLIRVWETALCVLILVISGVCAVSFATLDEARCRHGTDEDAILIYYKSWTWESQWMQQMPWSYFCALQEGTIGALYFWMNEK